MNEIHEYINQLVKLPVCHKCQATMVPLSGFVRTQATVVPLAIARWKCTGCTNETKSNE